MTGVVIPVIVHLWNDRRGKVLRIGSVVLMRGASQRTAWSARLTDILLLVVRCLLIVFAAALLAGPFVLRRASQRGWVLVASSAGAFDEGPLVGGGDWRRGADSLVKMGYERHVLDSGVNYWDAFRRMDTVAPAGVKFFVFTPGLVSGFSGVRPTTMREVRWKLYAPGDSVGRWMEKAYRVSADSIAVVRGVSRSTGTSFLRERVASRAGMVEGVEVDTALLDVVLDDGGNRLAGGYMRAALKALGDYTGHAIRIVPAGARVVRWRPEWEEAAWDGRLPVVLGELIFPHGVKLKDRRVIDPQQVEPVRVGATAAAAGVGERVDLRPVLWAMVFALFLMERILVFRNDKA